MLHDGLAKLTAEALRHVGAIQGGSKIRCVALHYCFSSILRRCSVVTRTGPTLSATESRPTDCLPSSLWTHRIWTNTRGQRMSGCSFGSNSGACTETTGRTLFQMQSKSLGAP